VRGVAIIVEHVGDDPLYTYRVEPFNGALPELQAIIGGYIEAAPSHESVTIWCNEDGKALRLPVNRLAMDVWIRWDVYGCMTVGRDWLAGNVVVTGGTGRHGETLDIPRAAAEWVLTVAEDAGAVIVTEPRPDWSRFGLVDRTEDDA
jgi:hypothetical protein